MRASPTLRLLLHFGCARFGVAHFRFQRRSSSSPPWPSLTVCACAKCGTTTVMGALYQAVHGRTWIQEHGQRIDDPCGREGTIRCVQNYTRWAAAGTNVSDARHAGSLHIIVWRDPVDRYVSAYHSKVKCCPGSTTQPCFEDPHSTHVRQVIQCEPRRLYGRKCLTKWDYVSALAACNRDGGVAKIGNHFRPQQLACPAYPRGGPMLMVTFRATHRAEPPVPRARCTVHH